MMSAQILDDVSLRLARYYLDKLRTAEDAYQHGHDYSEYGLTLLDHEWPQIKKWRDWTAAHATADDKIARLCMEYPQASIELLTIRQHPQERLDWLETGLEAARQLGDRHAEMVHLHQLGRTHLYLGSLDAARSFNEQALELAGQLDNPLYHCRILLNLASLFYVQDEYEDAQRANTEALALSKELDAQPEMGEALNGLGNIALSLGNNEYAYECFTRYLHIVEAHGQPHSTCLALFNLAQILMLLGQDGEAALYAERCVALCRTIGNHRQLAVSLTLLGEVISSSGDLTRARDHYQESLDLSRQMNRPVDEIITLNRIGDLFAQRGEFPESLQYLEKALSLSKIAGLRWAISYSLYYLTQVLSRSGDILLACQRLREGMEVVSTINRRDLQASFLLEAALIWHALGKGKQAAGWLSLLQQYLDILVEPREQATFDDLRGRLVAELGQQGYAQAVTHAKSLELDSAIEQILGELGRA